MSRMRFRLFGAFQARLAGELYPNFVTGKLEEMLCFLLLHQHTMTARERLASLLWGDTSTVQSKKYLRDALWKLQERLSLSPGDHSILLASAESVCLNPQADVWADVSEFETAFSTVENVQSQQLTLEQAQLLQQATQLYRGDLLEGWYQDWCLCERVRFQEMYLKMLYKLINWCESKQRYEEGLYYGETMLRLDRAHERAHRAMMRLRYQAGDRMGAIRQYEQCVEILRQEFDVKASRRTVELYEQIRADRLDDLLPTTIPTQSVGESATRHSFELLERCKHLLLTLRGFEQEVEREVESLERSLKVKK